MEGFVGVFDFLIFMGLLVEVFGFLVWGVEFSLTPREVLLLIKV